MTENINEVIKKIIPHSYLNDLNFNKNNTDYENMKVKTISTFMACSVSCPGRNKIQTYYLRRPNLFYKRGFCNIRCKYQDTIASIKLCAKKCNGDTLELSSLYNHEGLFDQLRKIYGITDNTIIPLVTEKIIPYLENYQYEINIKYNNSNSLDNIFDIQLSYDIVEIDHDTLLSFQYQNDLERIIKNNEHHNEIQKIITKLEYMTPRICYSTETTLDKIFKCVVNWDGYMENILIYTPNNKIIKFNLTAIVDVNNLFNIQTNVHYDNEYTIINIVPHTDYTTTIFREKTINAGSKLIYPYIEIELEKHQEQTIEIYAINRMIYELSNGSIIHKLLE